jgi:hypothetical protein
MRRQSLFKLFALMFAVAMLALATPEAQQVIEEESGNHMLTYSRGQPVIPIYNGWHPNEDGTIDLWFGYLNQNWREETEVPLGPDNNVTTKYGPDAGQPTHFLPRNNRFVWKITVPKDFPEKEVVWTLTTHGKTWRAFATLHPGYVKDDMGMQREYFGGNPSEGNKAPEITVDGELTRTVKVGEVTTISYTIKDDGVPRAGFQGDDAAGGGGGGGGGGAPRRPGTPEPATNEQLRLQRASICGDVRNPFFCGEPNEGGGNLSSTKGLRSFCFLYRHDPNVPGLGDFGNASYITFDPPQEKAWEDHRNGSPWATGYRLPQLPPDNKFNIKTSFSKAGTYTIRCLAHDGLLMNSQNITFNVTS